MDLTDSLVHKIMDTHETNDPRKIAKEKKIIVVYEDLGKNTWGYYACVNRISSIHVNSRLNEFQTIFTVGHELGHRILHPRLNTPFLRKKTLFSIDKIEREANQFAARLYVGANRPEYDETRKCFLLRCGLPEEFHIFY